MKRLVQFKAVILLIVLSVLLAACSSSSDDTNSENDKNNNDEELVLTLGETGTIKDTLGEYAVTIESAEAHDTFDGIEPEREEFQFVLINFTVENVGETELEGDAISIPTLITETGSRARDRKSVV